VLPLQRRQVDFTAGEVRLDAGTTKNGEGRVFPMTAALRSLLQERRRFTELLKRTHGLIVPWVFYRMVAKGRGGEKAPKGITALNKPWASASVTPAAPAAFLTT
jgi:hypothetical protein